MAATQPLEACCPRLLNKETEKAGEYFLLNIDPFSGTGEIFSFIALDSAQDSGCRMLS